MLGIIKINEWILAHFRALCIAINKSKGTVIDGLVEFIVIGQVKGTDC